MPDERYATLKLDKKIISDLDGLLEQTPEFKSRAEFVYEAISEYMELVRIRNSLNESGRIFFRDLLLKKRIEAYDEVKAIHGTKYVYYSGRDITPKGGVVNPTSAERTMKTKPVVIVDPKKIKK